MLYNFHVGSMDIVFPSSVLTRAFVWKPFMGLNRAGLLPAGLAPAAHISQVFSGANWDGLLCEPSFSLGPLMHSQVRSHSFVWRKAISVLPPWYHFPKISTTTFNSKKENFIEMHFLYKAMKEWFVPTCGDQSHHSLGVWPANHRQHRLSLQTILSSSLQRGSPELAVSHSVLETAVTHACNMPPDGLNGRSQVSRPQDTCTGIQARPCAPAHLSMLLISAPQFPISKMGTVITHAIKMYCEI